MNASGRQEMIASVGELSLLIDKQVKNIVPTEFGWLVGFIDQSQVVVSGKVPLATVVIASFANSNLLGIPVGFEKVLELVEGDKVDFVEVISESGSRIKVSVSGQQVVLARDPEIFEPPYSLQEFFEEVGPNIQKFATGRSLAPLPKQLFIDRVREFLRLSREGGLDAVIALPPLMITVGITDLCNFKCEMCFRTRKGYTPGRYIFPDDTLRNLVLDMASIGVRGLRFCGEGENMLHPRFLEILMLAKVVGLRTFIITNGTMLNRGYRICARCLDYLRVSFNALTPESYRKVHGIGREETYFLVLKGLKAVREERDGINSQLPIVSMSSVITNGNIEEALRGRLADDLRDVGLDFLVIKNDRLWEMTQPDKAKYFEIVARFEEAAIRVTDYGGHSSGQIVSVQDWEQKLGLGCAVRLMRANIDRFDVHSCVTEHEVYGVITEQRLPEIWSSARRSALQHRQSETKLKTCDRCFWGDFHRIINYLFEQEQRRHQ